MRTTRLARAAALCALSLAFAAGCSGGEESDDDADSSGEEASALTAGWSAIGTGVAYKATNAGDGVFIGYAGYSVTLDRSAAWVDALLEARLRALHVGHVYAVRGPRDPGYAA